jgi:hypothetical protein
MKMFGLSVVARFGLIISWRGTRDKGAAQPMSENPVNFDLVLRVQARFTKAEEVCAGIEKCEK